jgi:antitoxin MazE
MITKIVKIGNSRGLRLSKTLLEKYKIDDSVYLRLEENTIVIEPIRKPREGWAESFKEMHNAGDDELLIDDVFEDDLWE